MASKIDKFSSHLDHFHVMFPSKPSSSKRPISLRFLRQTPVYISIFSICATFLVHGLFLDNPNNIWRGTDAKENLSIQFSPASPYFLSMWCPLRSATRLLTCDTMQSVRKAPMFRRVLDACIIQITLVWWRQQTRLNFPYINTRQHGVALHTTLSCMVFRSVTCGTRQSPSSTVWFFRY